MQKMTWVAAVLALSAAPAHAQFDVAWVTYQNQTSARLVAAPGLGALDTEEKDYAVGDFDRDGWTDLWSSASSRSRRPARALASSS